MPDEAEAQILDTSPVPIYGSDISHRMVDFASAMPNAPACWTPSSCGGDALQRMPPCAQTRRAAAEPAYGERAFAAASAVWPQCRAAHDAVERMGRESAQTEDGVEFFSQLASHWKKNFSGWSAWMLTPDLKLPGKMRFKRIAPHAAVEQPDRMPPVPLLTWWPARTSPAKTRAKRQQRAGQRRMKILLRWPHCNAD